MGAIACSQGHQNPAGANFCIRCGEFLQAQNPVTSGMMPPSGGLHGLSPGTQLRDRYIIVRTLGQGGFGRTYLASNMARFNELVAIKELSPLAQGTYGLQKVEQLFEREAAILYKLQHPQIPRFWEFFREGKQLFLVQDYIEGQTYLSLLKQRVRQGECFKETEIVQLFRDLLPVLSYLHRQGVVHRDIAPDNIIRRTQDGLPVLIDLGGVKQIAMNVAYQLAGGHNQLSPQTNTRLGKVGYAPDEQMRLGMVAPYSDLYALGVTAVVLMTGKQPQELIDPQTMNWIWDKQLNLSPQFRGILYRMMDDQPAKRFPSADEILQLLDPLTPVVAQTSPSSSNFGAKTVFANNSGQGALLDASIPVPDEIQGWNWGGFLLPGVWCLTNHVWIGLIAWADPTLLFFSGGMPWLLMGIILGLKGNEWAWKSRKWRSIAAFKNHQRMWAIAGFFLVGSFLTLLLLIVFGFAWIASVIR